MMALHRRWSDDLALSPAMSAQKGSDRTNIQGTSGDDRLAGTDGGDNFHLEDGGDDIARGGAGDDRFYFRDSFTSADKVIGGDGGDKVFINTDTVDAELSADSFRSVEKLDLIAGYAHLNLLDGLASLRVDGSTTNNLDLDASQLSTGAIRVFTGIGDDHIIGGSGNDIIFGSSGADIFTGSFGRDRYVYSSTFDSTSQFNLGVDEITDFSDRDVLYLPTPPISSYHIGETADRVGDVTLSFDADSSMTLVNVYTNGDSQPDMTIELAGDHTNLLVADQSHLINP